MTKTYDNTFINSLDFLKECKNLLHDKCCRAWKGYGFQVVCNCECQRKLMLGRDESLPNTMNPVSKSDDYEL
jgi:hypothetical protein